MTYILTNKWPFFKKKELSTQSSELLQVLLLGLREGKVVIRSFQLYGSVILYDSRSGLEFAGLYHWNDYFYIVGDFEGVLPTEDEHMLCCQLYEVVKGISDLEKQVAAENSRQKRIEKVKRAYFND